MNKYQERLDELVKKLSLGKNPDGDGTEKANLKEVYVDKLPSAIFDVWSEIGLGTFFNGYFQLCDPQRYRSIVEMVFTDDSDFIADKTHVIGFSAFGSLLVWNETHRTVDVDLVNGYIRCPRLLSPKPHLDPNMTLIAGLILSDSEASDVFDNNGKGMFKRALSRLGPIPFGHIYGFRPILALGGPRDPERLSVYEALAHMTILAQAAEFKLMDSSSIEPRIIRMIGDAS